MPTIRELAKAVGVSESTVSIVLKGKAKERKISEQTQRRVLQAAQQMGYRPNVSARRLRANPSDTMVIAVFWASDFRAPMMVRFLRGLQSAILRENRQCELVIHPYKNNMLEKSFNTLSMCNAAIICNASAADMEFLATCTIPIPIVLYNRHSDKFCTVNVDDVKLGSIPAQVFASRGHKHAVILTSEPVFSGMDIRVESFIQTARQQGMTTQVLYQDNSMRGGYEGGREICARKPLPDCLFCGSDAMAIGALRAFLQAGVHIPEDMELISIGNGDRDQEEYAAVSLSIVHLPMEKMAEGCLDMVFDLLSGKVQAPSRIELPVLYHARESCGEML